MELVAIIKSNARRLRAVYRSLHFAFDRKQSETFYPDSSLKSRIAIVFDIARSGFVNRVVDENYFLFGADRRGYVYSDFPSYRQLMDIVDRQIETENAKDKSRLLRNKLAFAESLIDAGIPTPPVLATADNGIIRSSDGREMTLEGFVKSERRPLFAKPTKGSHGRGAFRLECRGNDLLVNHRPMELDEISLLLTEPYIVQPLIVQHPDMARLHPSSLNAMRIVTAKVLGGMTVAGAFLRAGTDGAVVDNLGETGVTVQLDIRSGRLKGPGFYRYGDRGRPTIHPDSGVTFDTFEIPFYEECVETALTAHNHIGGLITIGWDIAVTPEGPILIEGNTYWNPRWHIASDPDFLSRYVKIAGPWLTPRDHAWAWRFISDQEEAPSGKFRALQDVGSPRV